VKRNPYSVILLDEIEKAHPDVYNILLQVFEDGHLTDGLGNTIDFKNTIIIMTSNIGARFLSKHTSLGFQGPSEESTAQKMEDAVMQEVKRLFNPEFINRLDEIIIFNSLTNTDLGKIVDLMVVQLNQNLAHKRLNVTVTEDAKQWILDKACKDKNYGARPLRRAIQRYIEDPLSEALIQGHLKDVANVEVYLEGTQLWYRSADREEVGVPLTM
jgi:ATP-dependent Clp protease ATP-binding subunit ClpC